MTSLHAPRNLTDAALANIERGLFTGGNWAVTSKADAYQCRPDEINGGDRPVIVDLEEDDPPILEVYADSVALAVATALNAAPALLAEVRFLRQLVADLTRIERINPGGANDCRLIASDGTCARHGWGGTLEGRPCPWHRALTYQQDS